MKRITVTISERAVSRLEELCESSGFSKGEQVEALIDLDWCEWRERIDGNRFPSIRRTKKTKTQKKSR